MSEFGAFANSVIEAVAARSGAAPIMVRTWRGPESWRSMEMWRDASWISVDGSTYTLDGAAEAVRAALVSDPKDPEPFVEVEVADLRELLAAAPERLRVKYVHALDGRERRV